MSTGTRGDEVHALACSPENEGDPSAQTLLRFEVWSETSARLTRVDAARKEEVLAAMDVASSSWESSDMHWTQALAAEIVEGRMDRAASHGLRCAEEMARRRESRTAASADATAEISALRDEPALPFGAIPSAGFSSGRAPGFARPHPRSPRPLEGETVAVPALTLSRESTLPFSSPVLAFDRWTTQQYASLCAELSVFQAHSREVLARYHLEDDAARRRLDQDWERRVASDPQLGQEIQRLYTAYRAYLIKA